MKTKKAVLILSFLFLIIGMGSCEDKGTQYEIYENHEISACGVDDPLRNLDWLAEFTATKKEIAYSYDIRIELYGNLETQEEHIVMFLSPYPRKNCRPMNPFDLKQIYTCSGDRLFVEALSSENPDEEWLNRQNGWNEFFYSEQNQSQGIIWYKKKVN